MTWKRKLLGLMISRRLNTGDPQLISIFRYDLFLSSLYNVNMFMPFSFLEMNGIEPFWQLENYHQELEEMKNMTRQEFVAHLRRLQNILI